MKVLVFIRELFRRYPKLLIFSTVLAILLSLIEACSLFTVGPLIDFLVHPGLEGASPLTEKVVAIMRHVGLPITLGVYLFIFLAFISLSSGLRIFVKYSILKTKYVVTRDLMLETFKDFFSARWYFFSSGKQGTLVNTFMREFNVVGDAFGAMAYFFAGILQLLFCLAVPFYISWQVATVSLAAAAVFVFPFIFLGKISYRLGALNTSTGNRIGAIVQESLGLAKVILGFGNHHKSHRRLNLAFSEHSRAAIKSQVLGFSIPTMYQPLGVCVLIIALFAAKKFGVALSEMAVLLLALLRAVFSIGKLVASKHSLENFFPSYEQIKGLRAKAKQLEQPSGDKVFTGFNKEITVEGVSFAYPSDKQPVLVDINMSIPRGKMTAIVGESGVGKSTLIDLIMGFNQPNKGRIAFDGVGLQEFDINSYRRRIGYVPQDSVLFNMTISDNLLWAKEDAGQQEIERASQLANADEFIKKFPKGYDTLVGDLGVRLSGGQRQRIALARAILRRPAILFLDEATSSLDTASERLIQQAIENIAKETTIITIAHRLSTIANADYVYVFKQGRIIEEGSYCDLTKTDGHFNRMVKLQLLEVT